MMIMMMMMMMMTNRAMANLPQLEDYHILDRDDSHLLILSCHGLPEITFNGALVLSRSVMMMMMMIMMMMMMM